MKEVWADVESTEKLYQVSSLGNIRKSNGVMLKKSNSHGYESVRLTVYGKRKIGSVHRIVASAFVGGFSQLKNEVNHIDGNKANNRKENLEWCSRGHNVQHSIATGLVNYSKKITIKEAREIRVLSKGGLTNRLIANTYALSEATISEILKNKTWKE